MPGVRECGKVRETDGKVVGILRRRQGNNRDDSFRRGRGRNIQWEKASWLTGA